jgi:hypothetical protein
MMGMRVPDDLNAGYVAAVIQPTVRAVRDGRYTQLYFFERTEQLDGTIDVYHMDKSNFYGRFTYCPRKRNYVNWCDGGIDYMRVVSHIEHCVTCDNKKE